MRNSLPKWSLVFFRDSPEDSLIAANTTWHVSKSAHDVLDVHKKEFYRLQLHVRAHMHCVVDVFLSPKFSF